MYLIQMSQLYYSLILQLSKFQFDRNELRQIQDSHDNEILMTNRLLKKEMIDMADLVESVSKVLVVINDR